MRNFDNLWIALYYLSVLFMNSVMAENSCFQFPEQSNVTQHQNLYSSYKYLTVHLTYQSQIDEFGRKLFCYLMDNGKQSPTLRVNPGDHMIFTLSNEYTGDSSMEEMEMLSNMTACGDTKMTSASTNVHFHGSHTSPTCHQDEVIETIINTGETFTYDVFFPESQPPGLYWYHPHVHGISEEALQGGASGAVVVEGIENFIPAVAGLPEQIFVIRDQPIVNATETEPEPAWDLTINHVPISFPNYSAAHLPIKPSQKQFWRIVNAGADVILNLQLKYDDVIQSLELVALDGVPVTTNDGNPLIESSIVMPPGRRAEFIITAPSMAVQHATLFTLAVNTGPDGDFDPFRPVMNLIPTEGAADPEIIIPSPQSIAEDSNEKMTLNKEKLLKKKPNSTKKFFFSEEPVDPNDPNSDTKFFITREGDTPVIYSQSVGPVVVTKKGSIEDWIIENHSGEIHAFHIHQMHFLLLEMNEQKLSMDQSQFLDTVNVDFWQGPGYPYPSIRIRLDFTDVFPGEFVYHCHILEHEDKGMMAVIKVLPNERSDQNENDSSGPFKFSANRFYSIFIPIFSFFIIFLVIVIVLVYWYAPSLTILSSYFLSSSTDDDLNNKIEMQEKENENTLVGNSMKGEINDGDDNDAAAVDMEKGGKSQQSVTAEGTTILSV